MEENKEDGIKKEIIYLALFLNKIHFKSRRLLF